MTNNKLQFHDFTSSDWHAWAGCEPMADDCEPRILETEMRYGNGSWEKGCLVAIIDGNGPQLVMHNDEGDVYDVYEVKYIKEDLLEEFLVEVISQARAIEDMVQKYDMIFKNIPM